MRVDYQVGLLYEEGMKQIVSSADNWKAVCRMTGRLYRYEFDNILMVYMQRPNATLVADYDTWKDPRVGRYVKRGSKGIAIFPSRALKPYMRYVFDISDTGGRNTRLTWALDEKNKEAYATYLGRKNEDEKESAESFLKDFTENRIGVIMDSEFGERITELVHLAGTKRIMVDDETQEITAEEALKRSVMYAVFTRCGFDIPSEKQDFSFITAFSSEEEVYRLGSLVSDISCEVLKSISRELTQMERSIAYANDDLSRGSGRDVVPEPDITTGEHFHDQPGQIRSEGDGIPEGEPQGEVSDLSEIREAGREDAGSGERSQSDDGSFRERLSEEEPAEESTVHNGDVADKTAGEDAGRGNRDDGSRTEVSLEEAERQNQLNSEISRELEELESLGRTETGSYEQASFSFTQNGDVKIPEKYTYVKPKTELVIPHDYIREVLLRGSGFSHGKRRIFMEIYHEYKERMRMEPNFEALEVEEAEQTEPEEVQAEQTETIEKVEGEIVDQSGTVMKPASTAAFPAALEQVEAMEEDLREALELYMQGCSVIRPFQPFLQMVAKSELSKTDKLHFLNRITNHYGNGDTHSAYHNNAYGLIEYIGNSDTFMVDYKNRKGERKRASVTFEQIYSVMEYLIRAGQFTDKARMEKYEKDFAEKSYEKLDSLEKQFADKMQIIKEKKQSENFRFEVSELPKGGQKTRYQWNVEAIRLMKQIEFENHAATPDEQKILARYVGWGGIPQAFDERNESWKKEYEELKSLLSEFEYMDARESVNTAFYTSPEIIEAVYQGLSQLGFKQGTILEPSVGVGHFFGAMPEEMRGSKLYGVEKDDISGRIAKLLYPKAKIRIGYLRIRNADRSMLIITTILSTVSALEAMTVPFYSSPV